MADYDMWQDKHVDKEDCIPYFSDMPVESFFASSSNGSSKCRHDECNDKSVGQCKYKMCAMKFCYEHCDHGHIICRHPSCADYAVTLTDDTNVACCAKHYYNRKQDVHSNCKDCKTYLPENRRSIGYCSRCNGKWNHLRTQGISGPFGSGY